MTDQADRVLIVEDEPDINHLLAEVLSAYGLEPIQAFTGEDALRLVEKHRPDAILLDLMLPGLSGYAVCHQLKQARATRETPVVILTALDRPSDRREALETGADEFLTKPFTPESLVARIRASIERRRAAAEAGGHVTMTFQLGTEPADLKAINTLVTSLYCRTGMASGRAERLRAALVELGDAAATWATERDGPMPATATFDLDERTLTLTFEPAAPEGEAFLNDHLDPEATVPAGLVDAGAIDRQRREGQTVVWEKAIPPSQPPEEESPPDQVPSS